MKVAVLDGKHPGPVNTLQFNPRYMTFASACTNMVRENTSHESGVKLGLFISGEHNAHLTLFLCFPNRHFGSHVWITSRLDNF